jgi:protein-S-isoprenylcysteine O-methyltransferase Ste14
MSWDALRYLNEVSHQSPHRAAAKAADPRAVGLGDDPRVFVKSRALSFGAAAVFIVSVQTKFGGFRHVRPFWCLLAALAWFCMMVLVRLTFILWMVSPFLYFMSAGAITFTVPALQSNGAVLGQWSFISGMLGVLFMGLFHGLNPYAAAIGAGLAFLSVLLYEWTRRTVVDRHFYAGLAGEVPPAVCEAGPYRYVRHPFYASYMIAFVSMAVAFPSWVTGVVCLANMALFVYMAMHDERVLSGSALAFPYRAYQGRVGMFLPRVAAKQR